MSEDKIENEEEPKSLEKIRDVKDNDQLQDELKEWEVESTHEGD